MTIPLLFQLRFRAGQPTTRRVTSDHGGVSAPGLAAAVAVLVLVVGIVVTGAHEIILAAMRDALDTISG